jgi:hypothetical protein
MVLPFIGGKIRVKCSTIYPMGGVIIIHGLRVMTPQVRDYGFTF